MLTRERKTNGRPGFEPHTYAKALKIATYDPTEEVIPGMQGWGDRVKLNSLYGYVSEQDFNTAKKEFFKNMEAGKYGSNHIAAT